VLEWAFEVFLSVAERSADKDHDEGEDDRDEYPLNEPRREETPAAKDRSCCEVLVGIFILCSILVGLVL